jgi:hypothetical protein
MSTMTEVFLTVDALLTIISGIFVGAIFFRIIGFLGRNLFAGTLNAGVSLMICGFVFDNSAFTDTISQYVNFSLISLGSTLVMPVILLTIYCTFKSVFWLFKHLEDTLENAYKCFKYNR